MSDITFLQESHTAAAAYDRLDMRSAQRLLRRPLPIDTSGIDHQGDERPAQLDAPMEGLEQFESAIEEFRVRAQGISGVLYIGCHEGDTEGETLIKVYVRPGQASTRRAVHQLKQEVFAKHPAVDAMIWVTEARFPETLILTEQLQRLPGVLRVECYPGELDDEITVEVQIGAGDNDTRQQVYDLKWAALDRHPDAELDVWVVERRATAQR